MSEEPITENSDQSPESSKSVEQLEKEAKDLLVGGIVVVIVIAAIFAMIIYGRLNP